MRITFRANAGELRRLFEDRNGPTGRAVFNGANRAVQYIREEVTRSGRVRTGRMRAGIGVGRTKIGRGRFTAEIRATASYTRYQDGGTRYIEAAHFMRKGLDRLKASDFRP